MHQSIIARVACVLCIPAAAFLGFFLCDFIYNWDAQLPYIPMGVTGLLVLMMWMVADLTNVWPDTNPAVEWGTRWVSTHLCATPAHEPAILVQTLCAWRIHSRLAHGAQDWRDNEQASRLEGLTMRIVIGRGTHRKDFEINSHDARHNRPGINAVLAWGGLPDRLLLKTTGATKDERIIRRAPA
jgi:hypothetical protein